MEPGFIKGDSANLPTVDSYMVANFFACNQNFCSAEFRNVKTTISSRQSYGDDAIGYVQLKREVGLCVIKSKISPEHKVRQRPYSVSMVIDEKEGVVQSVQCDDCPASNGCCKHTVALLMWSHRRSEEPSCTATQCYWKKSVLSRVGSTIKFKKICEMGGNSNSSLATQVNEGVLFDFIEENKERKLKNCQILKHQSDYNFEVVQLLSLHNLSSKYNTVKDCKTFISNIFPFFTDENVGYVEKLTRMQHKSSAWYELRYARITASKAFDVTRCKTAEGSLVAAIMGARIPDTSAMKRGRKLEDLVKTKLQKELGGEIAQCGLFIIKDYPIIAASPDGIFNSDTVIEIKCPTNKKTFVKYIYNNKVAAKYYAQVQLQMHATKLKKCLFCVASWDFENNNVITKLQIDYDPKYVKELLIDLVNFWKTNIYPLIFNSTK